MRGAIVLLLLGFNLAPASAGAVETEGAVDAFLQGPRTVFAGCASAIEELFDGELLQHTTILVENTHNPWKTDYRHTIQSGPVSLVFLNVTESGRCLLEQVDITGHQKLLDLAFDIDAPRTEVIRILGSPSYEYPGYDIYILENLVGAERILIRYEDAVVKSLTWKYFID